MAVRMLYMRELIDWLIDSYKVRGKLHWIDLSSPFRTASCSFCLSDSSVIPASSCPPWSFPTLCFSLWLFPDRNTLVQCLSLPLSLNEVRIKIPQLLTVPGMLGSPLSFSLCSSAPQGLKVNGSHIDLLVIQPLYFITSSPHGGSLPECTRKPHPF